MDQHHWQPKAKPGHHHHATSSSIKGNFDTELTSAHEEKLHGRLLTTKQQRRIDSRASTERRYQLRNEEMQAHATPADCRNHWRGTLSLAQLASEGGRSPTRSRDGHEKPQERRTEVTSPHQHQHAAYDHTSRTA